MLISPETDFLGAWSKGTIHAGKAWDVSLGAVGVLELHRNSPPLYCLHHMPNP